MLAKENIVELDNGIKVYLDKESSCKTISLCICAKVGCLFEPLDKKELSHFVEHMMNKSNKKYSSYEINKIFAINAIKYNASTGTKTTSFIIETISSSFEKALEMLYYMFENDKYKENEFKKEKK